MLFPPAATSTVHGGSVDSFDSGHYTGVAVAAGAAQTAAATAAAGAGAGGPAAHENSWSKLKNERVEADEL